ncbi:MAG: hypothetical protein HZB31_15555 [Nitrospirae bacterium]|nr:hypothetical protein [Nitrospirota bacterium]
MELGLIETLQIKKQELRELLSREATSHGELSWLFLPENLQNKVALVAHIDTVHDDEHAREVIINESARTLWSPQGLGADDRAGVWTALTLFNSTPEPLRPIILFTDLEECGGHGAKEAVHLFADKLSMATFLVELDRRGDRECVFYNAEPPEFVDYVETFGFSRNKGTFSDISIICSAVNRCGVNLSIGYHHAHTKKEYLNLMHMNNTREALSRLLKDNYEKKKIWFIDAD